MSWNTPKTWTSEPLTSGDLNRELRDNLNALKNPPGDSHVADNASDYTTTSATFVDVDATNFSFDITPAGTELMVGFTGVVEIAGAGSRNVAFDVAVDGVRQGGTDGIAIHWGASIITTVSFTWLLTGLFPNQTATVKLQWRTGGGSTATLYAQAGTSLRDTPCQFWVREVS